MEIKFSCSTKELKQALKLLKAVLPKGVAGKRTSLEIDFRINEIDLKIQGAMQTVYCKTEGFGKVTVPFLYFTHVIRDFKEKDFHSTITDGKMNCGRVTISVRTDFNAPKATKKIDLPINFSHLDALCMRKTNSEEDLRSNNILLRIEKEESLKVQRIRKAFRLLKDYGITQSELLRLVNVSIYGADAFGE